MWNIARDKVKKLIDHAVMETDFYKNFYQINADGIFEYRDFANLPLLEKQHIRNSHHQLVSSGTKEDECSVYVTSGTTGIPIKYLRTKEELSIATIVLARNRQKWSRKAFSGTIAFFDRIKEPYKYHSRGGKKVSLSLSLYQHSEERYEIFYRELIKYNPSIIQGYASSLYQFSKFILDKGYAPPDINLLENRSEHISNVQRSVIEKAFNTKLTNIYGLSEIFPVAYECRYGHLHVCSDNVFVEIVCPENNEVMVDGEVGEIILTSLNCFTMPMIRYKSGDIGKLINLDCNCGSRTPILEIINGRISDKITTPEGDLNPVVLRRVFDHFYKNEFLSIAQLQFIQKSIKDFTIKIVPHNKPDVFVEEKLTQLVKECLNNDININFEWVNQLDPHPISGKVNTFYSLIENK